MTTPLLLAIDQGTTSSRAILFNASGEIISIAQKELKLLTPHKGWVEQDPEDIWNDTLATCREVMAQAEKFGGQIAGIGITNQRETTIVWDRETGKPLYNAIVWQDRRTADLCTNFKAQGHEPSITAKTGLLLDPYFSATKISWILENVPGARDKAEAGKLAFGTIDSFLLWRLTGGKVHATDITNASRTMLYNIRDQKWDDGLLKLFNISVSMMPEVHDNVYAFGQTDPAVFGTSYTIGGMAGDQQAALIGQGCFTEGMVKSTYGTGCFALMNIGQDFKASQNRLLTTVAYRIGGKTTYAIEGSIFMAGAAVQWLRDGLGIIGTSAESEKLATSVPDNNGVYLIPAFTGLGAPYWRPDAKAILTGLSRESTKAHIARAVLEAQAYQTLDLMAAMEADSGYTPALIRADGGLVNNQFVCQFLADMLDKPVEIPKIQEATAWGAACLAGLQAGVFKDFQDIADRWQKDRRYDPAMEAQERAKLYSGWQDSLKLLL